LQTPGQRSQESFSSDQTPLSLFFNPQPEHSFRCAAAAARRAGRKQAKARSGVETGFPNKIMPHQIPRFAVDSI
jgi:hypothetical protein